MARKKNDDHVRTITKVAGGKSYCITLPIKIVREMNWESQQKVIVRRRGNKIIIEDPLLGLSAKSSLGNGKAQIDGNEFEGNGSGNGSDESHKIKLKKKK